MRVLVACEWSGVVRDAFIQHGHDAMSCDLIPSESDYGPHFIGDVCELLDQDWDLMIAHPPCQYLSYAGNVWLKQPGRLEKRQDAFRFFMALYNAPIPKVCVENPPGYPRKAFRLPDQTVQPYQFGHDAKKATCFWLRNLAPLKLYCPDAIPPATHFDGKRNRNWVDRVGGGSEKGRKKRGRTFEGIAKAMAEQWGRLA